jgi:hypothetical protein
MGSISRCYCNASSLPHRHTKDGIVDAPDGKGETATPSRYLESSPASSAPNVGAQNVGVKKPIS